MAASQIVKFLVGAAKLNVGLDHHRVVALQHWVHQLKDRQWLTSIIASAEGFVRQHLAQCEATHQIKRRFEIELAEPFALPANFGALAIHQAEKLFHILFGVGANVFGGQARTGFVASGWITDLRRPVAHDQHDGMPKLLEFSQFSQRHAVANRHRGTAGVYAEFQAEFLARCKFAPQIGFDQHFGHATSQ